MFHPSPLPFPKRSFYTHEFPQFHQRQASRIIPVEGLTTIQSTVGPEETMGRLETEIKARGMRVFARVNHAALAAEAGLTLRPTVLVVFGSPRGGTPLMQANQTSGFDLPLKALVWQDASGKTWLSYNEPDWLAKRHGVAGAKRVVATIGRALGDIAARATNGLSHEGSHNEPVGPTAGARTRHRQILSAKDSKPKRGRP